MRWLLVAAVVGASSLFAGACVTSKTNSCGDLVCPESTVCVPTLGQCYTEDLVAVCQSRSDGDICTSAEILDGHCRLGVCVVTTCGDGVVSGSEDCEEGQMGDTSCDSLNFYGGTVSCGADCQYNTSNCIGFCGDGIKNGPEECDATDIPPNSCLTYGFDAGKTGCSEICSTSFATCERFGWSLMESGTTQYIESMWGTSASDYYSVGRNGHFQHFDGAVWSDVLLSDLQWLAIDGSSTSDAWAVGYDGALARLDADGWSLVVETGIAADLTAVLAVSASDAWAAGRDAAVLRFDGTTWNPINVGAPESTDFRSIASNGTIMALGGRNAGNESVIYRLEGATWSLMPAIPSGPTGTISALQVTPAGEIWALTEYNRRALRWNGTQWQTFNFDEMGGSGDACRDLLYEGDDSVYVACGGQSNGRPIWHYNGTNWVLLEWDLYGTARALLEFGGRLYAGGSNGVLAAFDRRGYVVQSRPIDASASPAVDVSINGISLVDRAMAVSSTSRGAAVWDGVTWSHTNLGGTTGTYTRAPCAIAVDLAYVAGASGTLHKYDGNTWQALSMPAPMNNKTAYYIKASEADNVWAVSYGFVDSMYVGFAAQWNGTGWTGHTIPIPSYARDLETFAANDTWVAGYAGGLSHWDGTAWTPDTFFTDLSEDSPPAIQSLGGVSSTDLYAGTSEGLYHRDATGWSKIAGLPDDNTNYRTIVANRADDVYALLTTGNPRLYHYDGTTWTQIRTRIPAMYNMAAVDGVVAVADSVEIDTLIDLN